MRAREIYSLSKLNLFYQIHVITRYYWIDENLNWYNLIGLLDVGKLQVDRIEIISEKGAASGILKNIKTNKAITDGDSLGGAIEE